MFSSIINLFKNIVGLGSNSLHSDRNNTKSFITDISDSTTARDTHGNTHVNTHVNTHDNTHGNTHGFSNDVSDDSLWHESDYSRSKSYSDQVEVLIISRDNCFYSATMRTLLKDNLINYIDLNKDTLKYDILSMTTNPKHTYPMVFIKGKLIGGVDKVKISKEWKDLLMSVGGGFDKENKESKNKNKGSIITEGYKPIF